MHAMTRRAAALLTTAAALAAPAAAGAGTVGVADLPQEDGQTARVLLFAAGEGETNSTEFSYHADGVTFYDTMAGGVEAGEGCEQVVTAASRDARCTLDGVQAVVMLLGDGNDRQDVPNLDRKQKACPLPLLVDAGPGDDAITTCRDADTSVDLGPGDDALWVGTTASVDATLGDGDDTVGTFNGATFGGSGVYDGGPGDDVLIGTTAREVLRGGEGRDRVEFHYNQVDANLDGKPGDSPEGDHVEGDVEELAASVAGSVISGNDAPNALVSGGPGVTARGLGGDDVLTGSDHGETLEGGAGSDRITAGFGDDTIDGGAGTDTIEADRQAGKGFAAGNDTVHARDGEVDRIACNIGADAVTADTSDVVDACEQVERADVAVKPATGTPAPGAPAPDTLRVDGVGSTGLKAALRRGVKVRVSGAGRVTAQLRRGRRVLARGAGSGTVTLRFTGAAKKRLRSARTVRLTLVVTAAGGATVTRPVTLR